MALTTTAAEQEDDGAMMATGLDGAFQVGLLDVSAMHEKVLSIFRAMQTTVNCPYYLGLGGCVTNSIMDYLDYIIFCINTYYVLSNPGPEHLGCDADTWGCGGSGDAPGDRHLGPRTVV